VESSKQFTQAQALPAAKPSEGERRHLAFSVEEAITAAPLPSKYTFQYPSPGFTSPRGLKIAHKSN
jgi:hypothetical protein